MPSRQPKMPALRRVYTVIISDDVDLLGKAHFRSLPRRGPPYFSSCRCCFRDIVEWKVDGRHGKAPARGRR